MAAAPLVSVVLATHNRADRLQALLESLREQTLDRERFEVVVVDDASSDGRTPEVLDAEAARGELRLTLIRRDVAEGPAHARNKGWRVAKAALIAFTDDDCVVVPRWLEAALEVAGEHPGAVIQGRTDANPDPEEQRLLSPFSHTVVVQRLGPSYETCNVFYPRELLELLGGFDEESFSMPGGEDTDLAWKAMEIGRETAWAEEAQAYHAVTWLGPIGRIRLAWRWHETILCFKRHPGLREHLIHGVFWKWTHYHLARTLLAIALPRRLWPLRWWLAAPYVSYLVDRRTGPLLAPAIVAHDVTETIAAVRGAIRYRVLVI
jgi:glycosyltransferase involved in cell wall biosynthesis